MRKEKGGKFCGGDIVIDVPTTEPKLGLGSKNTGKGHKRGMWVGELLWESARVPRMGC